MSNGVVFDPKQLTERDLERLRHGIALVALDEEIMQHQRRHEAAILDRVFSAELRSLSRPTVNLF